MLDRRDLGGRRSPGPAVGAPAAGRIGGGCPARACDESGFDSGSLPPRSASLRPAPSALGAAMKAAAARAVRQKAGIGEPAAAEPTRGVRQQAKAARRQELIEATIDSLAKRGYEATTLADVAKGAGLSRGIVNFHFETKEKLLVETLRALSEEYRGHWRGALASAGPDPAARLWALVSADFDRKVCTPRKLAAWCAFWGEAKSRPTYRDLCSANDEEYQSTTVDLVRRLAAPGQDHAALARALVCLLEGLWLNLMMAPKDFRREQALACARMHLAAVFPRHFTADGPIVFARAVEEDAEEPAR